MITKNAWPEWLTKQLQTIAMQDLPLRLQEFHTRQRDFVLQQGMPPSSAERWKYTDLSFLHTQELLPSVQQKQSVAAESYLADSISLSLKNGALLHEVAPLPSGVTIIRLQQAFTNNLEQVLDRLEDTSAQQHIFANLNLALSRDGLFIHLQDDCELSLPIHVFMTTQQGINSHPCMMLVLGKNSKLTLVEEYEASDQTYFNNVLHHIHLSHGASLRFCKIQSESKKAAHIANIFVEQESQSTFSYTTISIGSQFAREELQINLRGEGATCHTSGFSLLKQKQQYIDHHVEIKHQAAHTQSDMIYKSILHDKSRCVFNGKLRVEHQAQKVAAHQANHQLLLSKSAEAYSKPELEIYADDVKCKHGATTGQLDEAALFYLRARGITKEDAIKMLVESFASDVITRVQPQVLQAKIREAIT